MGRGAGGYVNLLSHSPVNTPCPGYRYRGSREALLDEVAPLVATTPPAACDVEGRTDALCPVQVHVQGSAIRERRRQVADRETEERGRKWEDDRPKKWIDLDENVLDGYILIDDACLEPDAAPGDTQEAPYPEGAVEADDDEDDADSHGKNEFYDRARQGGRKLFEDLDFSTTYPLANSHGNAYRGMSSHARYSELYTELAVGNYLEVNRDDAENYSVANSHGDHSVSCENRDRSYRENTETDQLIWDARQGMNYEIANSHSNYRVYYDSQTQQRELLQTSGWPVESWREHLLACSRLTGDKKQKSENPGSVSDNEPSNTDQSETKTEGQDTEPNCDIEQCLVQIEESLLNIEQNLLHVQDLDIPELRNLLYKSPSIEKSLFEVQDLLYTDSIVPVIKQKKKKSLSVESDEENVENEEDEEEEEEEEEVWVGRSLTIKDNDDEDGDAGAGPFDASNEESSDTANAEENNQSGPVKDHSNLHCMNSSTVFREEASDLNYTEKMNFIPNSLNKTLPRRILLDGTKENIRLCSSEPEESTIDYNLNTCAEKKLFCRDKCHSRTSSLDKNSTFPNLELTDKHEAGKSSLQNLLFDSPNGNSLDIAGKTRSEEILRTSLERPSKTNKKRLTEKRSSIVEGKTVDFRKKIESVASHRRSTISGTDDQRRTKLTREPSDSATRSREKSPVRLSRGAISSENSQDKDKESGKGFDKRKRKKLSSRSQSSSENALVPSKLISLSLSLLLAALLQAVRCLTDLVEDAFRSVSYDRGLLQ